MHPNLLNQLGVFRTIVETGSFSEAARQLHKTVSAVSYTISSLEGQLGFKLFDRERYRPVLTPTGRMLYDDAKGLLRRVQRLEGRLSILKTGGTPRLGISVDIAFPKRVLADALVAFAKQFPEVSVNIVRNDWERVVEDVKTSRSVFAVARVDSRFNWKDLDGRQFGSSRNVVVVSADHELARVDEPFEMSRLEDYRQIHLASGEVELDKGGYQVHETDVWTVPDDEVLRQLVLAGVGWAYVNRHVVWEDLRAGRLVTINSKGIREGTLNRFAVFWPVDAPLLGPSAALADLLREEYPAAYPADFDETFEQWAE